MHEISRLVKICTTITVNPTWRVVVLMTQYVPKILGSQKASNNMEVCFMDNYFWKSDFLMDR
jgi:hypothetical protein